jgi:subtilisin family serine protease
MARYLVSINAADDTAAQSAITTAGASVEATLGFTLTYEIEATEAQKDAISGLTASQLATETVSATVQAGATFSRTHLDTIVHSSGNNAWNPARTGTGKFVYLVDTGINNLHNEFVGGTIQNLWSAFADDDDVSTYGDAGGHGTAVASMIIGTNIGSAKDAYLQNVKLFNTNGGNVTVGEIINSLSACLVHHKANTQTDVKAVCLPWTIPVNAFVDAKILEMNASNMVVVAAAGNDGVDVNTKSPAGVNEIITVGSFNSDEQVTSFTNAPHSSSNSFVNYGAELDIFAIGVGIDVADSTNVSNYLAGTGTSLSAGLVAGVVTHYVQRDPALTSSQIKEQMLASGHATGIFNLTFDDSDASIDYSSVYKSALTTKNVDARVLTTVTSGRIVNVKHGVAASTLDLGLNASATDVKILDFAPLPPWVTIDIATGIITIDTTDASTCPSSRAPGIYLFAIRGSVVESGGSNKATMVEEFSIGLYTTNVSELDIDGDPSSFYYDTDDSSYDEVVNYTSALSSKP